MTAEGDTEPGPAWSAGAVARHLGIAASTLRSWNRRYGLGPGGHDPGRHRRYLPSDVAALETMCRLVAQGVAPGAAATWVRGHPPPPVSAPPGELSVVPSEPVWSEPVPAELAASPARAVSGLVAAALRLDVDAIDEAVMRRLREHGVVATWDTLCLPAITEVGRHAARRGECIGSEHLLSWAVGAALQRVPAGKGARGTRAAVLACTENERHTLGLEALRAALAERGFTVRMLGAATPAEALLDAVRRTAPGAVVLWSQAGRTARPGLLAKLRSEDSATTVVAGGAGWSGRRLPTAAVAAASLREAVLLVAEALAPTVTAVPAR